MADRLPAGWTPSLRRQPRLNNGSTRLREEVFANAIPLIFGLFESVYRLATTHTVATTPNRTDRAPALRDDHGIPTPSRRFYPAVAAAKVTSISLRTRNCRESMHSRTAPLCGGNDDATEFWHFKI